MTLTPGNREDIIKLFSMRQSGDYDDLFDWEENDVSPLIPQVEDYISRVQTLVLQSD